MKIISWNVNGFRAILKKGFLDFLKNENPEIICLQEIKANKEQVDLTLEDYQHHYWNSAERKGYSGTAIFSKIKPISVSRGIGHSVDNEGRVLVLEFEDFYLVTVYTPNSGRGLLRLDLRKEWDNQFLKFLKDLEKRKSIVLCGDLNVAHIEIDLENPKSNYNKTAGYTQIEIDGIQNVIDHGFIDTFREFNKEPRNYTYWGVWNNLRARNIGWRIDYFLTSKGFMKNIRKSFILKDIMGSDHCPVGIEL